MLSLTCNQWPAVGSLGSMTSKTVKTSAPPLPFLQYFFSEPSSSSGFSVAATDQELCVVITELLRPKLDLTWSMAVVFFAFGLVPGFPFWWFGGFSKVLVEDGTPVEAPRGWTPSIFHLHWWYQDPKVPGIEKQPKVKAKVVHVQVIYLPGEWSHSISEESFRLSSGLSAGEPKSMSSKWCIFCV